MFNSWQQQNDKKDNILFDKENTIFNWGIFVLNIPQKIVIVEEQFIQHDLQFENIDVKYIEHGNKYT